MSSINLMGPSSPMFTQRSALEGISSKEDLIADLKNVVSLCREGKLGSEDLQTLHALILASFPCLIESNSLLQLLLFVAVFAKNTDVVSDLVEDGRIDVNAMNADYETPLQFACIECEETESSLVGILLHAGADIELSGIKNRTPLMMAVKHGRCHSVQLLLSARAEITSVDVEGCNAVHLAAFNGNPSVVRLLLEAGGDPSVVTRNENKFSALHIACLRNNFLAVEEMLSFSPNPSGVRNVARSANSARFSPTALRKGDPLFAAKVAEQIQSINKPQPQVSIQAPHFPNLLDQLSGAGLTGLQLAADKGHFPVCRILLEYGANEDLITGDGKMFTPLLAACRNDFPQLAKWLIAHKKKKNPESLQAFIDVKNSDGQTPLSFAFMNQSDLVQDLLELKATIDPAVLMESRTEEDRKQDVTALHKACTLEIPAIVESLLQFKQSNSPESLVQYIDAGDVKGVSAMYTAALKQNFAIAQILVKYGATIHPELTHSCVLQRNAVWVQLLVKKSKMAVDSRDEGGVTLLNNALLGDHPSNPQILDFLLQNRFSGSIDAQNSTGFGPLHCAAFKGDVLASETLLLAGADFAATSSDTSQLTSLHIAAQYDEHVFIEAYVRHIKGKSPTSLQAFLDRKRADTQTTALFEAAKNNHILTAKTLISSGATIDQECLLFAMRAGYTELVELFLAEGLIPLESTFEEIPQVFDALLKNKQQLIAYKGEDLPDVNVFSQAIYALVYKNKSDFAVICDKMERISVLLTRENHDSALFNQMRNSLGVDQSKRP